jgi:membrane-bound ClpP family serine protease
MTKNEKDFIIENLKWSFSWFDYFERYFLLVGPISMTFGAYSMFYGGFKFGHIYVNNFMNSFFFSALLVLFLGVLLTYYMIKQIEAERKFKALILPNNVSFNDIPKKIEPSKWTIISKEEDVIRISTNISCFSWGEHITIISIGNNSILVNIRSVKQPLTINRDKINFRKLEKYLKQ